MHSYEVRQRKGGADLISEELPFGKLCYGEPDAISNAIGYAKFYSRAQETEVTVFDAAGTIIAEHRWDARTGTDLIT